MVRASEGKDFGGYIQTLQEEVILDQESVKSGCNMPRTKPPVGPCVFPDGWFDINKVPGRNEVFHYVFGWVYESRSPSFFIRTKNEIQIPGQNDITLQIISFFMEKSPVVYFFIVRIRSIYVNYTYQGIGVFLLQHCEDPMGAVFDDQCFEFSIIP